MANDVGPLPLVSVLLATIAIIIGTHGVVSCHTVKLPSSTGGYIEGGLFGYETTGIVGVSTDGTVWLVDYCRPYTDIQDDFGFSYTYDFTTLQRIAITIPILGGIALIGSCIFFCIPLPSVVWKFFGLLYLITCILQGVSLKVVNSSVCTDNPVVQYLEDTNPTIGGTFTKDCVWGPGFRESISAVVFWGIAAIICLAMPAPPSDKDDGVPTSSE